jgi:Icc-related predicted phosphoesterase
MIYDKRLDIFNPFLANKDNVLVHAGDFGVRGTFGEVHHFFDALRELSNLYKAIVFIPGNHDDAADKHPKIFNSYLKELPKNVYYLQCYPVTIDNIKFYGCPHTNPYGDVKAFTQYSDNNFQAKFSLEDHWELIPENTDVLITHSPPYGIMDLAKTIKCGSKSLLERVKVIKPKVHIFGHIHPGSGTFQTKDTLFVNAAVVDAHTYDIKHSAKIIPIGD